MSVSAHVTSRRRTLLYVPFLLCIAEHDKEQFKIGATARRVTCVRHLPPLLLHALFHTLATHCGDSTAARLCVMLVVILLRLKADNGRCSSGYTHAGLRLQRAQLTHVLASVSFTRMTRRACLMNCLVYAIVRDMRADKREGTAPPRLGAVV